MSRGRITLLGALLCLSCAHGSPPVVAHHRPIVVTLVVDQFAAWIAEERFPLLKPTGGFARLRREGVWVEDMRYAHAITETAPGHAALYTGRVPRDTGIVADELLDSEGKLVPFLFDPKSAADAARIVSAAGPTELPTVSLAHLDGETLADWLREAVPTARIVSLSFKDRAAVLPAGRHADAVLWFDPRVDAFVTSSAVAEIYPAWVNGAVQAAATARPRPSEWALLDPAFVAQHAPCGDAQQGEADVFGMGIAFPHPLQGPRAFRASPFGDTLLLETGARSAADEGNEPVLLLELSLSANDLIGHSYGPESFESWDETLRLDEALGQFFDWLDALVGPEGWSAILTADHGVPELPERAACGKWPWCQSAAVDRWQRPCVRGNRIPEDRLVPRLRAAGERVLGGGRWVLGFVDPYVVAVPRGARLARSGAAAARRCFAGGAGARARGGRGFRHPNDVGELPAGGGREHPRAGLSLGAARAGRRPVRRDQAGELFRRRAEAPRGSWRALSLRSLGATAGKDPRQVARRRASDRAGSLRDLLPGRGARAGHRLRPGAQGGGFRVAGGAGAPKPRP